MQTKIVKSTSTLILLTLFVKIIGLVKQSVIAYTFGISYQMDVYLIASDFISEVGVVFFSALSINLVTVYIEAKNKEQENKNTLFSNTIVVFVIFSAFISVILCLFARPIAELLAPGIDESNINTLAWYIRIFSIALVSIGIGNICVSILNAEHRFLPGKFVGIIQSVCTILACITLAQSIGTTALLVGFLLYYLIQNIFLLHFVLKYVHFKVYECFKDARVRKLIKLCIPLFLSNSVIQLNAIADKAIASVLGEGGVSALSYGGFVFNSIHSIVIGNLCTVLFTYFTTYVVEKRINDLANSFKQAVTILTFLLAPITVFCIEESELIVRILYARGAFDEESVALTTNALCGYSFGIIFIALRDLMMQILYAYQKTRAAMINGIVGVIINIIFSLLLSKLIGVYGIALADGVAYLAVTIFGYIEVNRCQKNLVDKKTIIDIGKTGVALIVCFIAVRISKNISKSFNPYLGGGLVASVLFFSYFTVSVIMKNQSLAAIKSRILKHQGG